MGRLASRLRVRHLGLLVGAMALGVSAAAILAATSEAMLQSQFAAAAAVSPPDAAGRRTASVASVVPAVSGSESYWLGEARHSELTPVALRGPLAIGDRMTIDGAGGKRVLEVVSLAEVPTSVLPAAEAEVQVRTLVLVTCRDVNAHTDGASGGGPVRFIIEHGAPLNSAQAKGPHAL